MSSQIFRTRFILELCYLLWILMAFANYLSHQGFLKTFVMMCGDLVFYVLL